MKKRPNIELRVRGGARQENKGCRGEDGRMCYERVTEGMGVEICMEFHRAPRRYVTEPAEKGILRKGNSMDKGRNTEHTAQLCA